MTRQLVHLLTALIAWLRAVLCHEAGISTRGAVTVAESPGFAVSAVSAVVDAVCCWIWSNYIKFGIQWQSLSTPNVWWSNYKKLGTHWQSFSTPNIWSNHTNFGTDWQSSSTPNVWSNHKKFGTHCQSFSTPNVSSNYKKFGDIDNLFRLPTYSR